MSQHFHPVPFFTSGSPLTDEYLASYTFPNGQQLPYPGMLGYVGDFDIGTVGAPNLCSFQLVLAAAAVTPAKGAVLYWSDKAAKKVSTDPTVGPYAGICPALMSAAASGFWMIKKGDVPVLIVDAPTVATALLTPVVTCATTGKADSLANAETQGAYQLIGVALGAQDGTSKLASVRVNTPDTW